MKTRLPFPELARNALIIMVLLVLILAPRPLAGSLDLAQAIRFEIAGKYDRASALYASAAGRLPWQPLLWEKAGERAWMANDPQTALADLQEAASRNALTETGWVYLGLAYQQNGDQLAAVTAWRRALPLPEAYGYLAQAERRDGNFPAAIADLRTSLASQPDSPATHYQLGLLLMATQPDQALPELMQAARLEPSLDPTIQGLRTALNTGLLSNDPADHFLAAGRGLAALREWDLAALAFRNAAAARPADAQAWAWLGEAQQQQNQDGKIEIERAVALDPRSAMVQSLYGLYLQRQDQPEAALQAFQKAAALEPENAGWQIALGSAYEQKGDLVAALEHYQLAAGLAPQEASVWRTLAEFSLRNSVDLAGTGLPAARRLMELSNQDWQSFDIAGQILLETGDAVGAEELLKRALALDPTQPAPALHLGLFYLQNNDPARAYSYLNQAKVFDPGGPYGWQASRLLGQYFP